MARLKKSSPVLETAGQRLASLKAFKTPPDFGPNLTIAGYEAKSNSVSAKLDAYNQSLATSDQLQNEFLAEEAELNQMNRRILAACEAVYGPDSSEYEMLGGTRTSECKRPTRKGGGGGNATQKNKSGSSMKLPLTVKRSGIQASRSDAWIRSVW
jgi:hypothetical protein